MISSYLLFFGFCLLVTSSAFTLHCPESRTVSSPSSKDFFRLSKDGKEEESIRIRDNLRQVTGFSMNTLCGTVRASTGLSLTAVRTACRSLTGISISRAMKSFTAVFPSSIRYFIQPFLILYFTPIMILREMCDRSAQQERLTAHKNLVESWKIAIERAKSVQIEDDWSVRVNESNIDDFYNH